MSSDARDLLVPSGRRVIVTGALGGLGRAIVALLAGCGCTVGICDVAVEGDLALAPDIAKNVRGRAAFDVRDRRAVEHGVAHLVGALGGCDAVVANAGVVDTIHRAERFPEEDWRTDIETNLSGQFHVVQAAFDALVASGDGRIVVISSAAVATGLPGQVAYTSAKAGLVGMARTLASEWAPHGIRCNVLMPGMIATPKVKALPEKVRESLRRGIPLQRFGEPAELAAAVAFLLSPAAAYITGTILRVDGGFGLNTAGLYRQQS